MGSSEEGKFIQHASDVLDDGNPLDAGVVREHVVNNLLHHYDRHFQSRLSSSFLLGETAIPAGWDSIGDEGLEYMGIVRTARFPVSLQSNGETNLVVRLAVRRTFDVESDQGFLPDSSVYSEPTPTLSVAIDFDHRSQGFHNPSAPGYKRLTVSSSSVTSVDFTPTAPLVLRQDDVLRNVFPVDLDATNQGAVSAWMATFNVFSEIYYEQETVTDIDEFETEHVLTWRGYLALLGWHVREYIG